MNAEKHIVITVFGSLGDLHPMMGLALGLQARGCRVTIATSVMYRERIEAEGIAFHPLGPDQSFDKKVYDEVFDPVWGPERLMRKYILPFVRETYLDLRPLLETADFLLNSPLIYAGPLIAEKLQMPWAAVSLQPQAYFSAHDPCVLPMLPVSEAWHGWGPAFWKPFLKWVKSVAGSWPREVYRLREELNLPDRGNPIFEGQFSPYLNLAMFSPLVARPQPDWPPNTQVTGFVFYDAMSADGGTLPEPLRQFLEAGEPPVVFTLGSSVVNTAGDFYEVSVKAAERLGCRAVFLAGDNRPPGGLTDGMLWWDYAPYSQLFPHAAAVVHQGGMGTTAQVMRAAKPMLVVPRGFDQPDNAARVKRLGIAESIYPKRYKLNRVTKALEALLTDPRYRENAERVGETVRAEDGVATACRYILDLL